MKYIEGGVCAAKGFLAAARHCGVKSKNTDKKDVAIIYSDTECAAAAVYTKNAVKAAPLYITKEHLKDGRARAILANRGNANACAPMGEENALKCCEAAAKALDVSTDSVLVASTLTPFLRSHSVAP